MLEQGTFELLSDSHSTGHRGLSIYFMLLNNETLDVHFESIALCRQARSARNRVRIAEPEFLNKLWGLGTE